MSDYHERLERAGEIAGYALDDDEPGAWNRRYRAALTEQGLELRDATVEPLFMVEHPEWVWAVRPCDDIDGWPHHAFIADLRE